MNNLKKTKSKLSFLLIFVPFSSFLFYKYVGFNDQIIKAIYFVVIPLLFLLVFPKLMMSYRELLYAALVRNVIITIIISMIMAYLVWGQSLLLSYRTTAKWLALIYFFVLLYVKPDIKFIQKIIWFFCIFYVVLWIYQMIKWPEIIFTQRLEEEGRGLRLFIPGQGFLYLGFFYAIAKFKETTRIVWALIFSALFVVVILLLTRQRIIFSFLIALFYLLHNNKRAYLWFGLAILLSFYVGKSIIVEKDSSIGKLIALSEDDATAQKEGDENIRITEYRYFITQYSPNILTDILGNGVTHSESAYGKMDEQLQKSKSIYSSDVGYAEIFIRFGCLGLLLYIIMFYRIIKQNVPQEFMYAKLFMIYVMFNLIASQPMLTYIIEVSICLYILELCNLNNRNEVEYSHHNIKL